MKASKSKDDPIFPYTVKMTEVDMWRLEQLFNALSPNQMNGAFYYSCDCAHNLEEYEKYKIEKGDHWLTNSYYEMRWARDKK